METTQFSWTIADQVLIKMQFDIEQIMFYRLRESSNLRFVVYEDKVLTNNDILEVTNELMKIHKKEIIPIRNHRSTSN